MHKEEVCSCCGEIADTKFEFESDGIQEVDYACKECAEEYCEICNLFVDEKVVDNLCSDCQKDNAELYYR